MISLHRSMHSSQMYTPGPAMSFLTCFWLLPQNEHFSRSPPSPMRATQILLCMGPKSREAGMSLHIDGTASRVRWTPSNPSAARDGRAACSRLGRHYLDRALIAALDHG